VNHQCIFCRIIAGQAPAAKVYEDDEVYAFRDSNPQAPIHILVVPKQHIARLADVTPEDAPLMGQMIYAARKIAEHEGFADGFRVVINNGSQSGQSVYHVHLHLLAGRRMTWPPG
jgi:histidine triad (HIT) family protein